MRPPFFINAGIISSGPAAVLDFVFFIILLISSYDNSSSFKLFIGPSPSFMLFILSVSGFSSSLKYFCHISKIYLFFYDSMLPSLSLLPMSL